MIKLLKNSDIRDGLLVEFVGKKLWSSALVALGWSINKRLNDIEVLKELKKQITEEMERGYKKDGGKGPDRTSTT